MDIAINVLSPLLPEYLSAKILTTKILSAKVVLSRWAR
jgi:hypothetical protein